MASMEMDPATQEEIARMRAEGMQVFGPAPMSQGQPMATPQSTAPPNAGCHIQIGVGHRWVEGFGGTPAEALADARSKLTPYDPTAKTHV